jgi:acylphosphatase
MPSIHLLIKGKVQGVFFRASTKDMAEKLDIRGWVKNTEEGDVEVRAQGEEESLEKFIAWCRKGPSKAIVTHVEINRDLPEEKFDRFRIAR